MKSLKDLSWDVSEEEYRKDKAYSYSTLAKFNREGLDNLYSLFDRVESPSLLFGSVVDCLLTDSEEEFDNRFLVATFPEISDSQKKIINYLYNEYKDSVSSLDCILDDSIIDATNLFKYQLNWKPETRAKVIKENCSEYWDLLLLAENKQIISQKLYDDALECKRKLKTSEATKFYFEDNNPFDKDIERFYQLKFKGEYEGIKLRCMADIITVNHKNKIIYPCDLKTSFKPEWRFYKSFIEWNYWIQAQLYWYIIRQNLDKDDYYKDFKLANYRFIVISNNTKTPLVWEFKDTTCIVDLTVGEYTMKNWRNIVKELDYYLKSNSNIPKEISLDKVNDINYWLNKKYE